MRTLQLTGTQQDLAESVRAFAKRVCGTREQRHRLTGGFTETHNKAVYDKYADLGWAGIIVPEEYGGGGGSMMDMCVLLEESMRGLIPVNGIVTTLVVEGAYRRFGSPQQRQEILGGMVRGTVGSIAMSEPQAGSDVGNLSCRAERTTDGWVVNGHKTWCSNAHYADHILLIARTSSEPGRKHAGLTMFTVPGKIAGLDVRRIDTMGGREVNDLYFTDCLLPEDSVVGTVDGAWRQLMAGLNVERLILAAVLLGIAQRAFDDVLAYVKQREQFGQPIGTFQAMRHRIADLATEIECARLLTYHVAQRVDAEPDRLRPREVSMAKLKATEVAKRTALEGMQMMGGYGYATEFDMEHLVRVALAGTIYGGANEIQRDIIGKELGL